jgi:uncharacterized protein YqhQ
MSSSASAERPYIGGQAVLEGVMMRSPTSFAVVVRRRDGSLVVREKPMKDERKGVWKAPLFRGVATLVESLRLGNEALRFSAEQVQLDIEAEEAAEKAKRGRAGGPGAGLLSSLGLTIFALVTSEGELAAGEKKGGVPGLMLALVLLVMVVLPQAAAAGAAKLTGMDLEVQSPAFQVMTGAFKLVIVLGYLVLIRRLPDIRRVFQYHGAEHKTISTYEANEPLDVEHAAAKTTLHPRCGTTFIVMVVLTSILVFTAVGGLLPRIHTGSRLLDNVVFFVEKLPFLPLLVGITFELQRIFARHCTTGPLRALLWPGFIVQKITTIEPDTAQLEVALASLTVTLRRERGEAPPHGGDAQYPSFDALRA